MRIGLRPIVIAEDGDVITMRAGARVVRVREPGLRAHLPGSPCYRLGPMPLRIVATILCLVSGCRSSSDVPQVSIDPSERAVSPASREPELPPLPPDLRGSLGDVLEVVRAHHAEPKPELDEPLETISEHQAWIDGTLEPWRERLRDIGDTLRATEPKLPGLDASDAEMAAWKRARFVHTALFVTLLLDESIAMVRIPVPVEVKQDSSAQAELREYFTIFLGHELEQADRRRQACTEYDRGGEEPLPRELEPWAHYCEAMVDVLIASACAAERRADLEPSVYCLGQRRYEAPVSTAARRKPVSMEELARRLEQAHGLCHVAEDVLEDVTIEPERRAAEWRSQLQLNGIEQAELLALVDDVLAMEAADAYAKLQEGMRSLAIPDWECAAIQVLLRHGRPGGDH